VLKQEVSNRTAIGELNIHNELTVKRSAYEAGFKAPEAKILIVDDNELNLEVEKKLLSETGMKIDTVTSGREALVISLKQHYDTILMDHLMPEMDGIECLEQIRNQSGGLNRTTPVVVLTANAGSDNRDLYHRAGFDGYLVKPVSGESLENTLIKHLPADKVIQNARIMQMRQDINASAGYSSKVPVIISSNSVCDLPASIFKKLNIPIIPAIIHTDEGVFKDGSQLNADELIRYMEAGGNVVSSSMDEAAYTDFFANALRRCHNLIHISIISSMSTDYQRASEAAKAFDNVTVVNSGCLSSATGLLVLIAHKLAQQNLSVEEIVAELMRVKERLMCSFIVDTTEYMSRKGFISQPMNRVARSLNLHPALGFKKDKFGVSGIWMGRTLRAYRGYIHKAFPVDIIPDPDVVFITYVDIPMDTLLWIREEIGRIAYFEHVIFQQASAAISSNCGSGTFGILYFAKSNKSYNLGTYLDDEEEGLYREEETGREESVGDFDEEYGTVSEEGSEKGSAENDAMTPDPLPKEKAWYETIEGIDGASALQNSGSEDSLKMITQLFYDAMEEKTAELN
ncbi:MAG: DegV family EDD domain-containing protein, partial [Lachnospiraceae bacterium]|nr:DegV family EDD domain-containing protein [Lachnospiraceae bacterium]